MGRLEKNKDKYFYVQDDGQVTARFLDYEEKMELSHTGSLKYKMVFYLLVFLGFLYLGYVFYTH